MGVSTISLGLGLGGGKAATSSGRLAGGGAFVNEFSISLDGTNDYIQLPNSVLSTLEGNDWSLSMWYNLDVVGSFQEIFTAGSDLQIYFRPRSTKVGLELYVNGGAGGLLEASPYSDINTWVHAVITRSSSSGTNNANMYINGKRSVVGTVGQLSSLSNPVIGCFNGASLFTNGFVDEVALFNTALSDGGVSVGANAGGDIATIYNSGIPGDLSTLNPSAWWRMGDGTEAGSGTTVYDMSSNSNNGTLTNGPTYSTSVPS